MRSYVEPLHRAELASLYRKLNEGKELSEEMIEAYLDLLGKNNVSIKAAQKLGLISGPTNYSSKDLKEVTEAYYASSQIETLDDSCAGCAVQSREILESPYLSHLEVQTNPRYQTEKGESTQTKLPLVH